MEKLFGHSAVISPGEQASPKPQAQAQTASGGAMSGNGRNSVWNSDGTRKDTEVDSKKANGSRTKFGPEHGTGNVEHNNSLEDMLQAAQDRGATDLRKNRVQRDAAKDRVYAPDGKYTKPDAAWIEGGVRHNHSRVSDLNDLDRELKAFDRMQKADPNAVNSLEF